ncbi:hypothetical protein KIPB_005652 [Kipferlia bialata]|uniref:Uncharacterized protein n=1 Tax=Kipferlia bialata TaxID=797122 RepID=A0A9K3CXB9_9EUKA|nr:hypothetical protein KIPB_005652 [Kipferlia bialata]|eukprot:g5652.t1
MIKAPLFESRLHRLVSVAQYLHKKGVKALLFLHGEHTGYATADSAVLNWLFLGQSGLPAYAPSSTLPDMCMCVYPDGRVHLYLQEAEALAPLRHLLTHWPRVTVAVGNGGSTLEAGLCLDGVASVVLPEGDRVSSVTSLFDSFEASPSGSPSPSPKGQAKGHASEQEGPLFTREASLVMERERDDSFNPIVPWLSAILSKGEGGAQSVAVPCNPRAFLAYPSVKATLRQYSGAVCAPMDGSDVYQDLVLGHVDGAAVSPLTEAGAWLQTRLCDMQSTLSEAMVKARQTGEGEEDEEDLGEVVMSSLVSECGVLDADVREVYAYGRERNKVSAKDDTGLVFSSPGGVSVVPPPTPLLIDRDAPQPVTQTQYWGNSRVVSLSLSHPSYPIHTSRTMVVTPPGPCASEADAENTRLFGVLVGYVHALLPSLLRLAVARGVTEGGNESRSASASFVPIQSALVKALTASKLFPRAAVEATVRSLSLRFERSSLVFRKTKVGRCVLCCHLSVTPCLCTVTGAGVREGDAVALTVSDTFLNCAGQALLLTSESGSSVSPLASPPPYCSVVHPVPDPMACTPLDIVLSALWAKGEAGADTYQALPLVRLAKADVLVDGETGGVSVVSRAMGSMALSLLPPYLSLPLPPSHPDTSCIGMVLPADTDFEAEAMAPYLKGHLACSLSLSATAQGVKGGVQSSLFGTAIGLEYQTGMSSGRHVKQTVRSRLRDIHTLAQSLDRPSVSVEVVTDREDTSAVSEGMCVSAEEGVQRCLALGSMLACASCGQDSMLHNVPEAYRVGAGCVVPDYADKVYKVTLPALAAYPPRPQAKPMFVLHPSLGTVSTLTGGIAHTLRDSLRSRYGTVMHHVVRQASDLPALSLSLSDRATVSAVGCAVVSVEPVLQYHAAPLAMACAQAGAPHFDIQGVLLHLVPSPLTVLSPTSPATSSAPTPSASVILPIDTSVVVTPVSSPDVYAEGTLGPVSVITVRDLVQGGEDDPFDVYVPQSVARLSQALVEGVEGGDYPTQPFPLSLCLPSDTLPSTPPPLSDFPLECPVAQGPPSPLSDTAHWLTTNAEPRVALAQLGRLVNRFFAANADCDLVTCYSEVSFPLLHHPETRETVHVSVTVRDGLVVALLPGKPLPPRVLPLYTEDTYPSGMETYTLDVFHSVDKVLAAVQAQLCSNSGSTGPKSRPRPQGHGRVVTKKEVAEFYKDLPLPSGWVTDGTWYMDMDGDRRLERPDIDALMVRYKKRKH